MSRALAIAATMNGRIRVARSMTVARVLGVAALLALAACTYENRRYGNYGNSSGQPYANSYGQPYGTYVQPYYGDYCAFEHCPPKQWHI